MLHSAMASATFQLAYGYQLQGDKDPFFINAQVATHHLCNAWMFTSKLSPSWHSLTIVDSSGENSDFFVNIFPVMSYVPDWFPGTGWKRTAREWKAQKDRAVDEPFEWAKAQVVSRP